MELGKDTKACPKCGLWLYLSGAFKWIHIGTKKEECS